MWAFGERVSPMIVCAVTLFPDPDSPTIATISLAPTSKETSVDRLQQSVLGAEADARGR